MKLIAHVNADGKIQGLIATPAGIEGPVLLAAPGIQVCEIHKHGLKGKKVNPEELNKLIQTHSVKVTPARGELVRRSK